MGIIACARLLILQHDSLHVRPNCVRRGIENVDQRIFRVVHVADESLERRLPLEALMPSMLIEQGQGEP